MSLITVGITGHRYLLEVEKIMEGVENTLQQIFESFPNINIRVISSLAEGTDQILAKRLLIIPNTRLWVPLPISKIEYLKDFTTTKSKEEFSFLLEKAERVIIMQYTEGREAGYLAAGKFIIENCNVLIAIWDGKPTQGKGGTAEIVKLARERRLPLAFIHAGNRLPGTSIATSLGQEQGLVTFENFPPVDRSTE